LIKVEGLNKKFPDGTTALKDINLEVNSNEFLSIIGPSGCGKTTLLRIMAGLETKTSGELMAPANLAMVFQSGALLPWRTTLQNAVFGLKMRGMSERAAEKIGQDKLAEVGLKDYESRYPRELSGGQRQRVGLARALAVNPQALLLDEPFSALDALTTKNLHEDLLRIWRDNRMTIVLVSHSVEEAVTLADRVVVMNSGQIIKTIEINLSRPRLRNAATYNLVEEIEKLLS
jgi:ABC-type nitrate/sulfonate/bicarbonate transport system ATPase subunit